MNIVTYDISSLRTTNEFVYEVFYDYRIDLYICELTFILKIYHGDNLIQAKKVATSRYPVTKQYIASFSSQEALESIIINSLKQDLIHFLLEKTEITKFNDIDSPKDYYKEE